ACIKKNSSPASDRRFHPALKPVVRGRSEEGGAAYQPGPTVSAKWPGTKPQPDKESPIRVKCLRPRRFASGRPYRHSPKSSESQAPATVCGESKLARLGVPSRSNGIAIT